MDTTSTSPRPTRTTAAAAGLLAAVLALATGEFVAGWARSFASPVIAVGDAVIERVPRPVKDLAIDWFGTNDKVALIAGILVLAVAFGAAVGVGARRHRWVGVAGLGAFALLGVVSAAEPVGSSPWAGIPSVAAWAVGSGALWFLLDSASRPASPTSHEVSRSRRHFLAGAGSVVVATAILGTTGRWLQSRVSAAASRMAVVLPTPLRPAPSVPSDVEVGVAGVDPWITPNADFYRIDINLELPQLATEDWQLRIHGMVDQELVLSYDELLARDLVEEHITLICVSNEVGGDLVGNARWLGVRLDDLLAEVGVSSEADQIVGRSSDGFTAGFPVDTLADGRPALVAVGMNGEPLPIRNGFPARLVVPGLYGYVSATKWLTEIELTRFDQLDMYWVQRDWSAEGPIKVMSRIDTPRPLARIEAGPVAVGGVAWAQPVGIGRVEVRIDDGDWQEAVLGAEATTNTWRQWTLPWEATPGRHTLTVRATDADGLTQTEDRVAPFPDGATGWHQIVVNVGD
ncbi:MAG: molybdopterin-dependent oxidoreductase [Acidimicrobiales bacterium]